MEQLGVQTDAEYLTHPAGVPVWVRAPSSKKKFPDLFPKLH